MKHKKKNHPDSVPTCRQLDRCMFEPRCWYRHDNESLKNEEMNDNSELLKKLIDMMEIFSNKIVNIEKNIN